MAKESGRRRVRKVKVQRSLKRCPDCDYADGFHVRFIRVSESSKHFRLQLVCPMCGEIFDLGLKVEAALGG